jgi:hypothetical protein
MTISQTQMRPYLLDIADMFLVYLEDKRLPPDAVEFIDFVRCELIWFEKHMHRRKGIRPRAPTSSRRITEVLNHQLYMYALNHPKMTQQQIGHHFKVSGARVNEALNGKLPQTPIKRPGPTGGPQPNAEYRPPKGPIVTS